MIKIEGIFFEYQLGKKAKKAILNNISFSVSRNEIVAILGPSGCGKSTLLRSIAGVLQPTKGNILINRNSVKIAQKEKQIGFAFQEPFLLNWLTVSQNIEIGDRIGFKKNESSSQEKLDFFLKLVGLEDSRNLYPSQLSGGMKQRVSFARALYTNPQLLLLDEPFSAIDILTKTKLVIELSKILNVVHTPTIIVTHHIEEAVLLADRVLILSKSPAEIVREISVEIAKPRALDVLEMPEFRKVVAECRDILFQSIEL